MITSLISKLSFVVFLWAAIACNVNSGGVRNAKNTSTSDTIRVDGCQQNVIQLKVGTILECKMEATPGTGYQWVQKDSSQLLRLLDPDNLKFTRPETKEPMPGAPGHQLLHFKIMKEGTETLMLEYKRAWETEKADQCELKIDVVKT